LCESILWNPTYSQIAFRAILKDLKKGSRAQKYTGYERNWILRVSCEKLMRLYSQRGRKVSPEEQINLDSSENSTARLRQFNTHFHRLKPEEQIILILRDKYSIPYSEIASALTAPEDSLKMQRQQALRTLEEWIWNNK
jgi:DNA-directed RNA polymerase specialized sigma24 family protein